MGKQILKVISTETLHYFIYLCFVPLLHAQDPNLPPVITFSQPSYDLVPGLDVTIRCLVDSPDSPLEEVTWSKNGVPLPTDNRIAIKTGTGFRSSDLVITSTDVSDEAIYTCSAKNAVGVGSSDVSLSMGNPFGDGQLDVFGNIAGERVGDNNINVFGDIQGEMTGSLSSPDVIISDPIPDTVIADTAVITDSPVVNPDETAAIVDTVGESVAVVDSVVDNVVTATTVSTVNAVVSDNTAVDPSTVVDPVKTDNVVIGADGAAGNGVDSTDPIVGPAATNSGNVVGDTNIVATGNDASTIPVKEVEQIKKQTKISNPIAKDNTLTPDTNKSRDKVYTKPETKEAPAPKKDRIIGGIGGGGFMSGKKEKAGLCSSQCRTNTDSCYRPVNCTHYETCFAQTGSLCECTKIRCAFGTFWNPQINNCDAANSVKCDTDPCLIMKPTETYSSGINCRSFYKCSWQNSSVPYCCDEGFAYDHSEGRCMMDEACTIPCSKESTFENRQVATTEAPKYQCFFRPVKGKPKKYWNEMANQEQDCPPTLVYRPDICVCGTALESDTQETKAVLPPKKLCDPVVFVDFTGKSIKNKSPRRIWIDPTDTQITRSEKGAQYGRFNGITSRISIPFLSGMTITEMMARLRFFTAGTSGPDSQVLFSNCETETVRWNSPDINKDLSPSIAIILNRKLNRLVFLGSTEDRASEQVMMLLPFKKNDWNNVELMFDGAELSARVRVVGKDKQALEFKNSTALTGRLTPAQKPMQIGRCNDQDGFFGYLDMVKIYDCIP